MDWAAFDGNKRKMVGAAFVIATLLSTFGVITPAQAETVNMVLSIIFGVAQADAMTGYVGRGESK